MKDLIARIAERRDEAAFRELFEAYGTRVRGFMIRSGADPATAEELAQEALLTVWRKADLYHPDRGSVASWIFTIARNLRIDRIRRETSWEELPDGATDEIPADDVLPDEAASVRQREARVRAVLDELSPEQREVITLGFIEGLSHGDISARLGLPLGTVKSRIRLAYQKVRTALEDLR